MSITATQVKELRERTGAGMMECKKALVETGGNMDVAVDYLRKSGQAKADRKAARVAADGRIVVLAKGKRAAIAEINSETDFVARDEPFVSFAEAVTRCVLAGNAVDPESLASMKLEGDQTVEAARTELVAKVGENISVRRFRRLEAVDHLGSYTHGARIGVLVSLSGGNEELARDIALHIAASNPAFIDEQAVPADVRARERAIFAEQAAASGKPADIVAKIVDGKIARYLKEVTLVGQPFVRNEGNDDTPVGRLLSDAGARVTDFVRYELGEGIEKKPEHD
ncbi:MAG: translation elongation factor Ts [Woeseiaceae bacterium]